MNILETPRLALRRPVPEDAPFILVLVNDPDWLRHIGDKNVHDLDGVQLVADHLSGQSGRGQGLSNRYVSALCGEGPRS